MTIRRWATSTAMGALLMLGAQTALSQDADVRIVLGEEPATLDPCMTAANVNGRVGSANVFEALTTRDPADGSVVPMLATGWEESGEKSWRFTLRDGVTFHDGTPMTAEAVKYSIDRMLNPNLTCETRTKFFGETGMDVAVIDATTVELTPATRDPILPLKMSTVRIHADSVPFDELVREADGTGPYQIAEWAAGQHVRLTAFDGYWGDKPSIATADFIWRAESSVRAAMVQQGEADLAPAIAEQDVIEGMGVSYPNAETTRLNLDSLKAPLDDIRVRKAINMAIDRDAMLGTIVSDKAFKANQLILPEINGYNPDLKQWDYDPEGAKALIEEARAAGVPVDVEIEFVGRIGHFPNANEFHEAIAIMLQQAGLNVKLNWYEAAQKNKMQVKPFDEARPPQIIVDQHDNTSGDPVFTLPSRWKSDGSQSKTADEALDALMDAAIAATGAERTDLWKQAAARIDELTPDAMLFHMVGFAAVGDRVVYTPSMTTNSEVRLADIALK